MSERTLEQALERAESFRDVVGRGDVLPQDSYPVDLVLLATEVKRLQTAIDGCNKSHDCDIDRFLTTTRHSETP